MDKPIFSLRGLDLVPLRKEHAAYLSANLCDENVEELRELHGLTPRQAIATALDSHMTYAVLKDGVAIAVTGIEPQHDQTAIMWAMFTDDVADCWVAFRRASSALIRFYQKISPVIYCDCLPRFPIISKWLLSLGFQPDFIMKDAETGIESIRFVRCISGKNNEEIKSLRPAMH